MIRKHPNRDRYRPRPCMSCESREAAPAPDSEALSLPDLLGDIEPAKLVSFGLQVRPAHLMMCDICAGTSAISGRPDDTSLANRLRGSKHHNPNCFRPWPRLAPCPPI